MDKNNSDAANQRTLPPSAMAPSGQVGVGEGDSMAGWVVYTETFLAAGL